MLDFFFFLKGAFAHFLRFCEKTWSNTPQHKIGFCQQFPDNVQWPAELGPKPPIYFNAGFFVYEPNLSTYHDLLETLQVTSPTLQVSFLVLVEVVKLPCISCNSH